MSALVIVLAAGIVIGNGPEAVSSEVKESLHLDGEWEGTWRLCNEFHKIPAGIRDGKLWAATRGVWIRNGVIMGDPYVLIDEGQDKLWLKWRGFNYVGIYRRDGDTVLICFREYFRGRPTEFRPGPEQHLFTFHRVKPRKGGKGAAETKGADSK